MIHSFLLIGQSNMAGRGDIQEAIALDTEHIKVLRNGRWQPMFRPVNPDREFSGVNLAESFAEAYAKKHKVEVGLIPCADGGTCLEQWKKGSLLYDNAVCQARLASRTSTIAGVLWHQGESDCEDGLRDTYSVRLEEIIQNLKKDLDLWDVPFILGGLGDFLGECKEDPWVRYYPQVNIELQKVAMRSKQIAFVPATGLTGKADNLHFDAKSLYEFGLRYFDAFEKVRDLNKVFFEKDEEDVIHSAMEKL